jgi:hypothetical protein
MGLSNYLPSSRISQSGVCTSTTRPASPYEGQVIYETDTDRVLVWNASAWVMIADTDQPPALQLIGTFTASGASRALVCDNIFTTEFNNYKIVADFIGSSNSNVMYFNLLDTSGNQQTGGYGASSYLQDYFTGTTGFASLANNTLAYVGYIPAGSSLSLGFTMDIQNPQVSNRNTIWSGHQVGIDSGVAFKGGYFIGMQTVVNQSRGIRFDCNQGTNITGTVKVYGYRN